MPREVATPGDQATPASAEPVTDGQATDAPATDASTADAPTTHAPATEAASGDAQGHDAPEQPAPLSGPAGEPDAEAVEDGASPAPNVPRVVVPRWIQATVLPLAILGFYELCKAAGTIFLCLLIACVIALILNPLAKMVQKLLPRGLAILSSYLIVLAIFLGVGVLLASPIANQVGNFSDHFPTIVKNANTDLVNVQGWLHRHGIKVQIAKQGQTALQTIEKRIEKSSGSIVSFSRDLLSKVVTTGVDIILTLVLSVYLLVYSESIGRLVREVLPPGDGTPDDDFPRLVQKAVSGYVRGQLLFSFIMGASCGIGLEVLGLTGVFPDGSKYAVFFGGFYGLMELIPYIGPILGPVPAVLVALFTNPISAVWLLIFFLVLQQLEGHIVAPQVFRISLRINPILVILALLVGYQLYGIPGSLVALPLATVIRQTVLYLRRHLQLESWGTSPPSPT